jgi:hypothetical protein
MSVIEIESELKKMTNEERLFVIEVATKLVRREFSTKKEKLKRSAEIMLSEYRSDKELTAMTAFDGEDFLDA